MRTLRAFGFPIFNCRAFTALSSPQDGNTSTPHGIQTNLYLYLNFLLTHLLAILLNFIELIFWCPPYKGATKLDLCLLTMTGAKFFLICTNYLCHVSPRNITLNCSHTCTLLPLDYICPSLLDAYWQCQAFPGTFIHIWWPCCPIHRLCDFFFTLYNLIIQKPISNTPKLAFSPCCHNHYLGWKTHFLISSTSQ